MLVQQIYAGAAAPIDSDVEYAMRIGRFYGRHCESATADSTFLEDSRLG